MVGKAHCETLKGRVGLTVTRNIRSQFWIPNLQQMPNKIFARCYGCKKFGSAVFWRPTTGELPKDQTEGYRPFQVVGIEFAGKIT